MLSLHSAHSLFDPLLCLAPFLFLTSVTEPPVLGDNGHYWFLNSPPLAEAEARRLKRGSMTTVSRDGVF